MMVLRLLMFLIFSVTIQYSQAQSKKLLRTYGVKLLTVTTIDYTDGIETGRYISFIEKFDNDGEWIERQDLRKDGSLKILEKRTYERGILVSELEEKGPEKAKEEKPGSFKHRTYDYHKGLCMAEKSWDKDGNLIESKAFLYDKFGNKISEVEKDDQGEIIKTEEFLYDGRGFRTAKMILNAKSEMIEKIIYEFD